MPFATVEDYLEHLDRVIRDTEAMMRVEDARLEEIRRRYGI